MENITINQKQLFDVIKRTISLSEEYAIEKLDADGNYIVFINGDFTNFFILRKSLVVIYLLNLVLILSFKKLVSSLLKVLTLVLKNYLNVKMKLSH